MKRAFSLVELSIVLVILGLLVGGILAGQSLIRAAELRSVSTEFQRYQTALSAFKDKYFAVPGDMANATSIWGTATTCPGTSASPSTSAATCNGNGDGLISPSSSTANELFRFWHHLANAGLIEGSYTGVSGDTTATNVTSIPGNVPASKVPNGYWFTYNFGIAPAGNSKFEGTYYNSMQVGGLVASGDPNASLFRPEELWNIDTKLDDGLPAQGKLTVRYWSGCTNAANNSQLTATYALTTTTLTCTPLFRQVY